MMQEAPTGLMVRMGIPLGIYYFVIFITLLILTNKDKSTQSIRHTSPSSGRNVHFARRANDPSRPFRIARNLT